MLKYTINKKHMKGDLEPLEVSDYSVAHTDTFDEIINEMREETEQEDIDLTEEESGLLFQSPVVNVVTVTCSKYYDLEVGRRIAVSATREVEVQNGGTAEKVNFYEEYRISSVSDDRLTFTIDAPSIYRLTGKNAYIMDKTAVDGYVTNPYVSPSDEEDAWYKEVPYDVETEKRYIYLTFDGDHYFRPDDFIVIAFAIGENGNPLENKVPVWAEYVSRHTLRVEVPKDDRRQAPESEDDIDYIAKQDGDDDTPATYYYKNRTETSDLPIDTIYPYKSVTQERVNLNGDTFTVIDKAGEDVGPVLYRPYYGDIETAGDDVEIVNGVPYEKVPADFYRYRVDGEETPDYYGPSSDYIADIRDNDVKHVYIADYIYAKMNDGEYHLLSNEGMYNTQEYLYPTDEESPECPAWILNIHLFGMNVSADNMMVDIDGELIYREAFMFQPPYWGSDGLATVSFSLIRGRTSISIPLISKSANGLNDEASIEDFVAYERERAINPIREMEKNVYHPCGVTEKNIGGETVYYIEPVKRIKFNLHFRKRDENWNVIRGDFWNGVEVDEEGKPEIVEDYFSDGNVCPEKRSDLLYALGFTNNDVRYQKNKLKKSFIRLSFYDSDDETKQNLLGYSTIFYDGGRAFKRFAQNFDTVDMNAEFKNKGKYYVIDVKQSGDEQTYDINRNDVKYGIRVTREYDNLDDRLSDDELEEVRLSSQFTVESRSISTSSSEGFYLYLWKDDYNPPKDAGECMASTIYMRVDFNHAGYGRVVPFMMPYGNVGENVKVLNFSEILSEWEPNEDDDNANYKKNDIQRFNKYAYIKLNRSYVKSEERYYYFPDPDVYGSGACYEENGSSLVFNLYEGKIYEGIIKVRGQNNGGA